MKGPAALWNTVTAAIRQWWLRVRCPSEFLCDNCRYDYPSACSRPQRPNATRCPDYKPK